MKNKGQVIQQISDYANSAKVIGHFDQMASYYSPIIWFKKWYLTIILHLLEVALHNSYILFPVSQGKIMTFLEFRKSIIRSLVSDVREKKEILPTPKKPNEKNKDIIIVELEEEDCKLEYYGKTRCKICEIKNIQKYTSYCCGTHKIPVCILSCYDTHRKNLHIL